MYFTKSILSTVFYALGLLAPALALADAEPGSFQADKERQIAIVLESVQIAQKNLSCVQAAQDLAALNACNVIVKKEPKAEAAQDCDKKAPKVTKNNKKK